MVKTSIYTCNFSPKKWRKVQLKYADYILTMQNSQSVVYIGLNYKVFN